MNIVGVVPSKIPHSQNSIDKMATINGIFLNIIKNISIKAYQTSSNKIPKIHVPIGQFAHAGFGDQ